MVSEKLLIVRIRPKSVTKRNPQKTETIYETVFFFFFFFFVCMQCLIEVTVITEVTYFKGIVHTKMKIVIICSPSCCFKSI